MMVCQRSMRRWQKHRRATAGLDTPTSHGSVMPVGGRQGLRGTFVSTVRGALTRRFSQRGLGSSNRRKSGGGSIKGDLRLNGPAGLAAAATPTTHAVSAHDGGGGWDVESLGSASRGSTAAGMSATPCTPAAPVAEPEQLRHSALSAVESVFAAGVWKSKMRSPRLPDPPS